MAKKSLYCGLGLSWISLKPWKWLSFLISRKFTLNFNINDMWLASEAFLWRKNPQEFKIHRKKLKFKPKNQFPAKFIQKFACKLKTQSFPPKSIINSYDYSLRPALRAELSELNRNLKEKPQTQEKTQFFGIFIMLALRKRWPNYKPGVSMQGLFFGRFFGNWPQMKLFFRVSLGLFLELFWDFFYF